ncbi:hypothetical protein DDZ14_07545 [Maritimibacter sp. 55A14]|nr:hypothetical protein DDZ14_07545 [Maritimibacter sp. 55A14]
MLAALAMLWPGAGLWAAEITLDPGQRFQTMSGWEATADLPDNPTAPVYAAYRAEQLDRTVAEVGINRVRLEIRSGAESSTGIISRFIRGEIGFDDWKNTRYQSDNDNDDPFTINWDGFDFAELDWHVERTVLPLRDRLARRGERLIVNLCYVAFDNGQTFHMAPEEYAEFVLATYLHLDRKYGFTPDLWELVLEPDLPRDGWTGAQMGAAMAATSKRLRAHGFTPAFVAPSVTNMKHAVPYVEAIADVPGAMRDFVELSYHRYGGRGTEVLRDIARTAGGYGLRTGMLEWWFGRATHEVLHEDLTVGMNSAWQGRVVRGLHDVGPGNTLSPRPEVRYTLQYFRHVRHGAVRIGAATDSPGLFDPVAFVNPDGRYTVVVKAARAGVVAIAGLPEGRYRVSYAVRRGSAELPAPVATGPDRRLAAEIPGAGVLTVTAE